MAATRRATRRLGNENAAAEPRAALVQSNTLANKPAPTRRVTRSSLAGTTALASKTTNKSTLVPKDAAAKKPLKATTSKTNKTLKPLADDVFMEDAKPQIPRPVKPLKRSGLAIAVPRAKTASTTTEAVVHKAAGIKRPSHKDQAGSDGEAELEKPLKKRLRTEAKDEGWEDLDEGDEEDPLMVTEYVCEVYDYLRELELKTLPDPDYMTNKQEELSWRMRGILIDWLIEIHVKFRLLPETIFLTANIIDRFCSSRAVSLVKYQLMGITALFIACKYEEIISPSLNNFLYMTDGGYTEDDLLKAERYVLQMIGWDLSYPNPIHFLRRISKADEYDIQSRTIAKYLMEISIVDKAFLGKTSSVIAAAGAWLARKILDRGEWDANLVHYSGYSEEELLPTAQLMVDYTVRCIHIGGSGEHPNFNKKYASKKFFKASEVVRQWVQGTYLADRTSLAAIRAYQRQLKQSDVPAPLSSPHPPMVKIELEDWNKYLD